VTATRGGGGAGAAGEDAAPRRASAAPEAAPRARARAAERQFLPEPRRPWIRRTFVVVEASDGLPPPALEVSKASRGRREEKRRRWSRWCCRRRRAKESLQRVEVDFDGAITLCNFRNALFAACFFLACCSCRNLARSGYLPLQKASAGLPCSERDEQGFPETGKKK